MEQSRSIQVSRLLRPIRLGFLLKTTDSSAVQKAIEMSTCRWGGMGCPMVPRYRQRPASFPSKSMTATEIAAGYLATFEPDKLVVGLGPSADGLPMHKASVVQTSDLEETSWKGGLKWGVSALDLYRHAHAEQFRFVQHNPLEVLLPQSDDPSNALLFEALFGRLPEAGPLAFMRERFVEAFRATEVVLDAGALYRNLLERAEFLTPLRVAMRDLERSPHRNFQRRPIFVLVRPSKPADIADYWNLRALGLGLVPIGSNHTDLFAETYADLAAEGTLAPEFRTNGDRQILLLSAQGVGDAVMDYAAEALNEVACSVIQQRWFPPLWSPAHLKSNGHERAVLESDSDNLDVSVTENWIAFRPLAPKWSVESGLLASASYVNVIRLTDFSWEGKLASVLPPDLHDLRSLLGTVGAHPPTASSEGIVVEVGFPDLAQRWRLPNGTQVFKEWLRERGMVGTVSPAGRTAEQFIAALGGPLSAHLVQEPPLIRLINQAARGLPEESSDGVVSPRRRVIRYNDLRRVLQEVTGNDDERVRGRLGALVAHHVLRQGLMVQCSLCDQENWYPLEELSPSLTCERCLQAFPFPTDQPPGRERWAYRPSGPFSTENFADGAYAVALAMRFFHQTSRISDDVTWTTSMKVEGGGIEDLEFDFGLWFREDLTESQPQLLLGECKSFGKFEATDFERARALATAFPGCILVFATLKSELDETEREAVVAISADIAPPAGRVIVLTANELCSSDDLMAGPLYLWEQKGGRFAEIAERYERGRVDLSTLAEATSELYVSG